MTVWDLPHNAGDALTREEVKSVIDGRTRARRVPIQIHFWVRPDEFGDRRQAVLEILRRYPADFQVVPFRIPDVFEAPPDAPDYRWVPFPQPCQATRALDEQVAISNWHQLDEVLAHFPTHQYPGLFQHAPPVDGRYRLGHWWFCLFERHWQLRGMVNALMDYYDHPKQVHRLYQALTDYYIGIITRGREEQRIDGVLTSDDLGTQRQPFFSPQIFQEFFKPYYRQLMGRAHDLGMHFWLHACGNVEPFIPEWIDTGLDVLHPIQKYAMDERTMAAEYGSRMAVWAGLDVQQVIPFGTPGEVRAEVRHLMDTYWRTGEGRVILSAGNAVSGDCPLENLEAFFDEAMSYGSELIAAA